ncbi:hypothetical protein C8A03DRAFT_11972 [Achaetomium macrosporum]|uniref:Uncharacterized protein n=1 Tax=Achaetomium macrosporum TaxID=79813 RepID=A0AAN7CIP7_9PEZI|nr:hypothetical protein C8A03DRAFT_11972 [Achaetomium macrosporum]
MNPSHDRRPALATSFSTPNIFCRPFVPPPAPVVYVNGWNGVGKETVSECLTLLLGKDKSLLIDVRSVGWDSFEDRCRGSTNRTHTPQHKQQHKHQHEYNSLLTPEHPRYLSFDIDYGVNNSIFSSSSSSASSPSCTRQQSTSPSCTSRPTSASSDSTSLTTNSTISPLPTPTKSSENLTRLLSHPSNRARIAVLPACAPDTPGGRATLRTFEAAASRAGRLFVPVALTCAPGEHARRIGTGPGMGLGMGLGWAKGQGLAMPMSKGLTVDITCVTPFEAALQIVEFVRGLQAEWDAELCTRGEGTESAPADSLECERG